MFARTERLMLRPGWIEDAPALAAAIGDEATVRNLARVPFPYGVRDAEAFIARCHAANDVLPNLMIFARSGQGPQLVGGIGLHRDDAGAMELGYWIAKGHRGRGFATEAGAAMVRLAHKGLRIKRIVAGHFLDNPASARVLRKLGFRPTGRVNSLYSAGRREEALCAHYERDEEAPCLDAPRPLAA